MQVVISSFPHLRNHWIKILQQLPIFMTFILVITATGSLCLFTIHSGMAEYGGGAISKLVSSCWTFWPSWTAAKTPCQGHQLSKLWISVKVFSCASHQSPLRWVTSMSSSQPAWWHFHWSCCLIREDHHCHIGSTISGEWSKLDDKPASSLITQWQMQNSIGNVTIAMCLWRRVPTLHWGCCSSCILQLSAYPIVKERHPWGVDTTRS